VGVAWQGRYATAYVIMGYDYSPMGKKPWISGNGGLEHEFYFSIQLGMSSSQLTFIFFRGVQTTNQIFL
jgi:hypothetical protein